MITINLQDQGSTFIPFWKTCVGAGRANEALRASFQKHLKLVQENIGFQYLRFHGLLHDDMFVVRKTEDGEMIYNFQYIDEVYDTLLEMGIRPFVELGFFPGCIKGGDATQFWWRGNITPPDSWSHWCELIKVLVLHWQERYGKAEVEKWYFEVWNEPNLHVFWDGTKSQYFSLYAATVKTIKEINPALRVGGPATSNFVPDNRFEGEKEDISKQLTHRVKNLNSLAWHGVWIKEFLNYCAENHLPVDFVSAHPYPTDFAVDITGKTTGRSRSIYATKQDMTWMHETVKNSAFPNAEIHLTEWSSSPSPRDCTHDFLQEATFIVKCNLDSIGLADSLSYWTFTDVFEENGAGDSIFHGGFGLINYQGIVKPSYHAYRMLSSLGNECIYRDDHSFFTRKNEKLAALLYHYPISDTICMSTYPDRSSAEKESTIGVPVQIKYLLKGLPPKAKIRVEILDHDHGWALPAWQRIGSPESPDQNQVSFLKAVANSLNVQELEANMQGQVLLDMMISPWSILLIAEE